MSKAEGTGLNKKDEIYDYLVDGLVNARYAFGERLLVKEIGAEIGVSRQSIMAALNRLAVDGFVRIIPQVGCQVVDPDRTTIADFFRMFARMEGLLVELAAERRTDRQLRDLKAAHAQIIALELGHPESGRDYVALNQAFHRHIHAMAASPFLAEKQRSSFNMSDFFINHAAGYIDFVPDAVTDHDAMIAAITDKAPDRARRVAELHIQAVARAVLKGLELRDQVSSISEQQPKHAVRWPS